MNPVQRGEACEYWREVVAEDREVRAEAVVQALHDRDSWLEMRVGSHRLVEDQEVVRRALKVVIPAQRELDVGGGYQNCHHAHAGYVRCAVPLLPLPRTQPAR